LLRFVVAKMRHYNFQRRSTRMVSLCLAQRQTVVKIRQRFNTLSFHHWRLPSSW
jgi:hypothetical protein